MNAFLLIGSVILIHIFAWFTPGPNLALIIRNSLIYSRKTGFFTAVGFAISNYIHIILSVTGIGLIIANFPLAASVIKLLGAVYLIYLGLKTIFKKIDVRHITSSEKHHDISPLSAIKIGLITNILSPKAPLFFGSIFGTLLSSSAPSWVIIFLIIEMPFNTLLMANLWSFFFTQKKIRNLYKRFQTIFNLILGGILVLLAFIILFSK